MLITSQSISWKQRQLYIEIEINLKAHWLGHSWGIIYTQYDPHFINDQGLAQP